MTSKFRCGLTNDDLELRCLVCLREETRQCATRVIRQYQIIVTDVLARLVCHVLLAHLKLLKHLANGQAQLSRQLRLLAVIDANTTL